MWTFENTYIKLLNAQGIHLCQWPSDDTEFEDYSFTSFLISSGWGGCFQNLHTFPPVTVFSPLSHWFIWNDPVSLRAWQLQTCLSTRLPTLMSCQILIQYGRMTWQQATSSTTFVYIYVYVCVDVYLYVFQYKNSFEFYTWEMSTF